MYLQNSAAGSGLVRRDERVADAATAASRRDLSLRLGVALLLASGAVLGIINLLAVIHLVAVALGG